MLTDLVAGGVLKILGAALDRIFPDPVERARAHQALEAAERDGRLQETKLQLSAILAEAQSADPWTSRARPTFLYVVYVFILAALPMGALFAVHPDPAGRIAAGAGQWLAAIPEPMWWLFGAGYLGYTAGRSFDKWRGGQP